MHPAVYMCICMHLGLYASGHICMCLYEPRQIRIALACPCVSTHLGIHVYVLITRESLPSRRERVQQQIILPGARPNCLQTLGKADPLSHVGNEDSCPLESIMCLEIDLGKEVAKLKGAFPQ
ncbi:putative palmitoyltransferase ZDHHC19 [Platysternon megacephalum]|uniref:Putative palmitoyltransferase ZDHHC19 n=1 Tax=Platysternon megacephalum TaxID=55544 RepID=A0A4D9EH49_9SAUR|nr:putative palmitoyltransferase ZDHHC19 [Platysternon megacephalum]